MPRNYRIVIGAFAAVMLLLLIKSSTTVKTPVDMIRTVSQDASGSQEFSTQPINEKPGYIVDNKTEQGNSAVAQAIKEQETQSGTKYSTGDSCKKEHQYVVMIDAGSSGSRVHVYEFDVCTQPPTLIHETFKMLKPGLSSYENDAAGAARSLDPLLKRALEAVPEKKRGCTPISVKATAGLRMLGESKSDKILTAVHEHLEKSYPFPIVKDGISIMSGEDEGVFAWVTTNYLLGNIGGKARTPTAAVFDLGGGSTQIVFEPTFAPNERMLEGEHKYELKFGEETYTLYQFSHLGYGLMEGRNKINAELVQTAIKEGAIPETSTKPVKLNSPCLPPGTQSHQTVKLPNGKTYTVDFEGPVSPAGSQCRFLADKILNKDSKCTKPPCSFNGVHQPSLVQTFKETNDLFVFSFFYDKTQPLGLPLSFKLDELFELAKKVCNGEEVWKSVFSGIEGSVKQLKQEPEWCQDLTFQVSLLHTGYDIPLHRELKTANKIANNELGWCLGASLPLIEPEHWKCKVNQVA